MSGGKVLWQELAAVQLQLEQAEAKLTPLADANTQEDCGCMFCLDLRTAAENARQAVLFLAHAVAAERRESENPAVDG